MGFSIRKGYTWEGQQIGERSKQVAADQAALNKGEGKEAGPVPNIGKVRPHTAKLILDGARASRKKKPKP